MCGFLAWLHIVVSRQLHTSWNEKQVGLEDWGAQAAVRTCEAGDKLALVVGQAESRGQCEAKRAGHV